jgi:hypothetical protein
LVTRVTECVLGDVSKSRPALDPIHFPAQLVLGVRRLEREDDRTTPFSTEAKKVRNFNADLI